MCKWYATYCWKALDKGYNFAVDLTSIEGLHKKLYASKVTEIPISRISGFPTWVQPPVVRHRNYYKGEGGGFLQV